ncbi:MAG: glutamate racemase [candidate division Zixibacteria bacterium]|nr:glutamate racemase [candidate division Zixibacteria bacterium]
MPDNKRNRPIGIFDSGVGGLTVMAEVIRHLPNENIVYFGDVGRCPYGGLSKETIIQFARQDIKFLLEHDVKYIIAACNSVSAVALETVKKEFDIEILGVINPGAKAAADYSKNKRVGVIGTVATIGSNSYATDIQQLNNDIKIFSLACPLFVPLAEEGYLDKEATRLIALDYLKSLIDVDIDTLVLGCTHYPLLKNVIAKVMGDKVKLVDSAEETARQLTKVLEENSINKQDTNEAIYKLYVSDMPDRFSELVHKFLGSRINNITRVDITRY